MLKKPSLQTMAFAGVVAMSVLISACSSSDDESTDAGAETSTGDESELNPNLSTFSVILDSASTVPPAVNAEGASGEGSFSVDTSTGAISGSVTVSGTTGTPTIAHIHRGGPGDMDVAIITMIPSEENTVWTVPADAVLDTPDLELFNNGELYVNVHTEANVPGELRSQLVDANIPAAGSLTITFRNTSGSQPMTPPVVVLHNAPDAENGVRLYEVGTTASEPVINIAEDGNLMPLVDLTESLIPTGQVSAVGVAELLDADAPALLPGASATLNLQVEAENQVMSLVSMVVCTNDGFSGIDSRPLSADASETFLVDIYDAGSETNLQTLNYWVPPCGGPLVEDGGNIGDDEGSVVLAHPGQAQAENPIYNFEPGTQLLEVTVTRN